MIHSGLFTAWTPIRYSARRRAYLFLWAREKSGRAMSDDDLPAVPDNVDTNDELSKVAANLGDDDEANARKIDSS